MFGERLLTDADRSLDRKSTTDAFGSEVPVRARRKLPLAGDPRDGGQCHRHERRRTAGSKVLRAYVAGNSQWQVPTVAVVHPSKPTVRR